METTLEQKHCVECGKILGPKSKRDTCMPCRNKGPENPMRNPEIAKKSGLSRTGEKHPLFGKHHTIETREQMSFAHSGEKNHMYGKRFYGEDNPNYKGRVKPNCNICGKKLTRHDAIICQECYQANKYGSNNPNWKDGITLIGRRIRNLKVYKEWYGACLERDDYTCQRCGSKENLEVHHVIPVGKIIKDNSIKNSKMALDIPELWMLELGITYCVDCHCLFDKARYFSSIRNPLWSR